MLTKRAVDMTNHLMRTTTRQQPKLGAFIVGQATSLLAKDVVSKPPWSTDQSENIGTTATIFCGPDASPKKLFVGKLLLAYLILKVKSLEYLRGRNL